MTRRLLIVLVLVVAVWLIVDVAGMVNLDTLRANRAALEALRDSHPLWCALGYFAVFVAATALSLPGSAVLTMAGGALFGLVEGTLLASFAAIIGGSLAFLMARHWLRDLLRRRLGPRMAVRVAAIDAGIERDGAFYLLAIRLMTAVPYFIVNFAIGLTSMPLWTFYWISQLGMLPSIIVFANAGTQLATVHDIGDVLSARLLLSFVLLAVMPLLARYLVRRLRN